MAWIGKKRLALVPLFRTNAHPPDQVPADWEDQILRRMLFDPMPGTSVDRSLRAARVRSGESCIELRH